MRTVHEPLVWRFDQAARVAPERVLRSIQHAARGPARDQWEPPEWLMPHQRDAARRVAGALQRFGGALLADAVGLGKTYVSLAVATTYHRVTLAAPACLLPQWKRIADTLGIPLAAVSHETLSRGAALPPGQLIIVDEAHRVRNPATRRYDSLARGVGNADVLLVTATPIVNRIDDLTWLLRLFLPDHALAPLGLPSLERQDHRDPPHRLLHAVLPLVVARPADVLDGPDTPSMPRTEDRRVGREPPVAEHLLRRLLTAVDELEFPGFGDDRARALLRMHLLRRLASSSVAFRQSLRRHLVYLDRAAAAATRGERLSRSAARLLGCGDDLQLELASLLPLQAEFLGGVHNIESERVRLLGLLRVLPTGPHPNPKASELARLLTRRAHHKTIVFATAEGTAIDLARRLHWRRVAVVSGGRARVASGKLPVEAALRLFAPRARGAPSPSAATEVNVLVATDLVSEGLDLQDADAVVHYDLPWTPERLAQRVGRIARLGSLNERAEVYWFRPPSQIEQRLHLCARLDGKAARQMTLPVPATSRVGRGRVTNRFLLSRERLIVGEHAVSMPRDPLSLWAVVTGPLAAVAAVSLCRRGGGVPQVLMLAGQPLAEIHDVLEQDRLLRMLAEGSSTDAAPPARLVRKLLAIVRQRFSLAGCGPVDPLTRRLRRSVLASAWCAGRDRAARRLALLDRVLNRLQQGVRVGAGRQLVDVFESGNPKSLDLDTWLGTWAPLSRSRADSFRILAVLFGDGSDVLHPRFTGVPQSAPTTHLRILRP